MKVTLKIKIAAFFIMHFAWFKKIMYMLTMAKTKHNGDGHPVKETKNVRMIVERLDFGRHWTKDPKVDTMYHPRVVQRLVDNKWHEKHSLDCDDHAGYYAAVLVKSQLAKRVWVGTYNFIEKDTGAFAGHALCVFEDRFGNYLWMDYDYPMIISNKWQWVDKSAQVFNVDPVAAVMFEVVSVDKHDTPKFGKIETKGYLKK